VIAIFTKFDGLDGDAFGELLDEGILHEDAKRQAPTHALANFEKEHLDGLYKRKYHPRGHVYLRGKLLCMINAI